MEFVAGESGLDHRDPRLSEKCSLIVTQFT
jgi:hypothetical protein